MTPMSINTAPPPPPPSMGNAPAKTSKTKMFKQVGKARVEMRSEYVPEWKARLLDAGMPTDVVVIDFETYFDPQYSLRKTKWSTVEYITDKRFESLGVSILDMDQPFKNHESEARWYSGKRNEDGHSEEASRIGYLQTKYGTHLEKCTVVMHNARFDAAILSHHYGINPPHIIDTLGLARHWNSRQPNDLDTLTKQHGLTEKGDTLKFSGWTHRTRYKKKGRRKAKAAPVVELRPRMTAEEDKELGQYANNDTAREWEVFMILLPLLSNPHIELRLIQHTLELFLKPELHVDPVKADEIVAGMTARMDEVVEASGMTPTELRGRYFDDTVDKWVRQYPDYFNAEGNRVAPGEFRKPEKSAQGWKLATANDDWQRDELLKHPDDRVRLAMEGKVAVHSWPNHIKRVRRIISQARANGGCLPVPLKYHGAHTGRFSGDEKINLQNLGERNPEPLIRAVRELLIAQPDHTLAIADLSAIEGRGVGWIADEQGLLQDFRDQDANPDAIEDVYTKFASRVLGEKIVNPGKAGLEGEAFKHMKWGRNSVGKVGVLGGGYGMGAEKAQGLGDGLDLPMAKRIIDTYRSANPKIVQFWKDIEAAFIYAYKYNETVTLRHNLRVEARDECDVVIILPNGRELKYHKVRIKPGKWDQDAIGVYNANERSWGHLWGGHLTENIVQAFCRDILTEAMLRCEDRGVRVVHHVHDELIAHTLESMGDKCLAILIEELTRPLPWAPDFPLAAEGVIKPRYGGH